MIWTIYVAKRFLILTNKNEWQKEVGNRWVWLLLRLWENIVKIEKDCVDGKAQKRT